MVVLFSCLTGKVIQRRTSQIKAGEKREIVPILGVGRLDLSSNFQRGMLRQSLMVKPICSLLPGPCLLACQLDNIILETLSVLWRCSYIIK